MARLQEALRKSLEDIEENPITRARKLRCEMERIELETSMLNDFLDVARSAASELEASGPRGPTRFSTLARGASSGSRNRSEQPPMRRNRTPPRDGAPPAATAKRARREVKE